MRKRKSLSLSQVKKAGLIIDGPYNAGGLDPFIFLNRLARKPISYGSRPIHPFLASAMRLRPNSRLLVVHHV